MLLSITRVLLLLLLLLPCCSRARYLDELFDASTFPSEIMRREDILSPACVEQLLQAARANAGGGAKGGGGVGGVGGGAGSDGEVDLASFVPRSDFKLVLLTGRPVQVNSPLYPFLQSRHVVLYNLPAVAADGRPGGGGGSCSSSSSRGSGSSSSNGGSGGGGGGGGGGSDGALAAELEVLDEFRSFCSSFRDLKRPSEALVEFAFDGDAAGVQRELDKGYYVDSCEGHGYSALSEAAVQGHAGVMALLLDNGANPNFVVAGKDGRTPLHR